MTPTKWLRVNRKNRCSQCGSDSWCGYSEDGAFAICMRSSSDKPTANGGYLHRLTDKLDFKPVYRPAPPPPKPIDAEGIMAAWRLDTPWNMIDASAQSLGVSGNALDALGVAYSQRHQAWAYPMLDGHGNAIGIRLRNDAGEKWAVSGSRSGLFFDPRVAAPADHTAYVVEGPTDTAAALTMGLFAVGRAACLGQADQLRVFFRNFGIRRMVVIADNDEAKERPDGQLWYPGKEGAARLIAEMKMESKLILPPAKDLRKWLIQGATKLLVECAANQKKWTTPK